MFQCDSRRQLNFQKILHKNGYKIVWIWIQNNKKKSFFYIPFLFTLSFNKTYGTMPSSNAEYLVFILLDYLHRCWFVTVAIKFIWNITLDYLTCNRSNIPLIYRPCSNKRHGNRQVFYLGMLHHQCEMSAIFLTAYNSTTKRNQLYSIVDHHFDVFDSPDEQYSSYVIVTMTFSLYCIRMALLSLSVMLFGCLLSEQTFHRNSGHSVPPSDLWKRGWD